MRFSYHRLPYTSINIEHIHLEKRVHDCSRYTVHKKLGIFGKIYHFYEVRIVLAHARRVYGHSLDWNKMLHLVTHGLWNQ